ncbi:MAG: hypothetical protein IKQ06_03195 [Bacilli bacterium]|nr:hypothetical protein [Bacilli bacterium]MBR6137138.1 hypothetical protein [Bacilli bacterium]
MKKNSKKYYSIPISNNDIINKIVLENRDNLYKELEKNWTERIKRSNELIECITNDNEYLSTHHEEVLSEIENLNNALDYYAGLGINEDEMGYEIRGFKGVRRNLEKNYRTLSLKYYHYMFEKNNQTSKEFIDRSNNVSKRQSAIEKKMSDTNSKIESLGATFLNIVLTISIVSSMVAILVHVPIEYAIPIGLLCTWLLLSSILFICEYFKNNTFVRKESFAKKVYFGLSIVTLLSFSIPLIVKTINNNYDDFTQKVYIIDNQNDMKYRLIDDKTIIDNFINSFYSYWESHDNNFGKYKYSLDNEEVLSIIIYNYYVDKNSVYRFELFFSNGKTVSFNTDNEDLEEWLTINGINVW